MLVACVNQDPGVSPKRPKGAAVHLMALRDAFRELGAEVAELDEPSADALRPRLDELHARQGIDLIYERYALGAGAASDFAAEHPVPHVLEVNAPLLDEAARHRGVQPEPHLIEVEQRVMRRAHRVLAVSREVARYVTSRGVDPERVWVRPNAVDPRRFVPRAERPVPAPPGVPEDALVLGFHGRLRPWHGFDGLVATLAELLRRDLPVHLLVVGEGDYEAALAGRVPEQAFTRVGWCPPEQVATLVARYDLMALTYPPDAPCYFSPLKLLEAMAVGAVPLVPDLGDLAEVVTHDQDGVVYPPGELACLADELERLVVDPDRRQALGAAAVQTARGRSWKALAEEVLSLAQPTRSS